MVRRATTGDREAVWPLVRHVPGGAPPREAYDRAFGTLTNLLDTCLVVAETPDDGLAGYLLADHRHTLATGGPVVWVSEVAVLPAVRGRGLGRALVHAAEEWGRTGGAARVCLATSGATGFYRALGYTEDTTHFGRALP
ncbi:ribosomal protein S18 acetylase RimI-like enzyme [Cellulomonas sp. PhB143]|nr:ribosomal protein S18 acetylase RimI-like enzyme [Cellulomonas sp. PhB143]